MLGLSSELYLSSLEGEWETESVFYCEKQCVTL